MSSGAAPASGASPSLIPPAGADTRSGNHFSCTMSAVLLGRVHDYGGDAAVGELLRRAGISRPVAELLDIANWISYDEAVALWRAGAQVTHHPQFARWVGEDSARRLNGSPVATLLRSLGSPENVFRQIATTATKYTTVSVLESVDGGPGWAVIAARPVNGFPRSADHCAWTVGLFSQPTRLFGLGPAAVQHDECAAFGAPACVYRLSWEIGAATPDGSSAQTEKLREQLDAMKERLHSMFQTAGDLIGSGDVDAVLARIAERAAVEVRAPRHLLAVRMSEGGRTHCHHKGFDASVVGDNVHQLLHRHPSELPANWLVVPVRSTRHDYGRLLAAYDEGVRFFPEERELLEVYARYAASALDSATALLEAERRYAQSSALLQLARALAAAGTSAEVARRLADSVPTVVDCDQVGVYIWHAGRRELVRQAITRVADGEPTVVPDRSSWPATPGGVLEGLLRDPNPTPLFLGAGGPEDSIGAIFAGLGFAGTVLVPLASRSQMLGLLTVSVRESPERLTPSADLLDRLSGVAAQATTALQNGRLVDVITHQALHDQLTGLANRLQFTTELGDAMDRARETGRLAALMYLDLDHFKPVNDEFGHATGDALLVAVAERLKRCTRAADVVARLGGDEFAVLVGASDADDVAQVARRVAAAFDDPFEIGGHRLSLGVSVGTAAYPADAGDADGLLRAADAAMFAHKRTNRPQPADVR